MTAESSIDGICQDYQGFNPISFEAGVPSITVGPNCSQACKYISSMAKPAIKGLCSHISEIENDSVRAQASAFCDELNCSLAARCTIKDELPPFIVDLSEDDEAYFEWVFTCVTIGFSFNADESKSGWFYLIHSDGRNVDKKGNASLKDVDYREAAALVAGLIHTWA